MRLFSLAGVRCPFSCTFLLILSFSLKVSTGLAFAESDAPLLLAAAEKEELETELQLVSTPYRYEREVQQVGSAVTVIGRKEIEAKRVFTVLELLRTVPGVEVAQTGGPGRTASLFIRGSESDQVLVLIDGVRVNSNTVGNFDFSDLSVDNIERIEILRGPQSVLYGSEAIGGVIQIFSRKGEGPVQFHASAQGGSFGTHREQAGMSYGTSIWDISLASSYYYTEGISAANEDAGNSEADSYENISVASRSGINFLEDGRADFTFRYQRGDTEVDNFDFGVGAVDDNNATQTRDLFVFSSRVAKPLNIGLTPSIEIEYGDEEVEGTDPDTVFNNFDVQSSVFTVTPQLDINPFEGNVLSVGYTFESREAEIEQSFDEERELNSFFVQDQQLIMDRALISAGARYDEDSEFGEETTYRGTLVVPFQELGSRLHASLGTGFKAPSFNELFFPNFGNPDLGPETSLGWDVGFEQRFFSDKLVLDLTYFDNEFDDLITFDPTTFLAANIDNANSYGFELSLAVEAHNLLQLDANYTFTESENELTGALLPWRPKHRLASNVFIGPWEGLSAALTFIMVNEREDTIGNKMDDYERVDLVLDYKATQSITPFIRFENLFDADYEEVPTYGTPGFSVFAGIELRG